MKNLILPLVLASITFSNTNFAEEKVLYEQDMGPETPIYEVPRPQQPRWEDRDKNFDELPPEADWPARHSDPYPEEVILELDRS